MKHFKEVVKEVKETVLAYTSCDICYRETRACDGDWSDTDYKEEFVHVMYQENIYDAYDNGGRKKVICYDLCPSCFQQYIVNHLQINEAIKPITIEEEW